MGHGPVDLLGCRTHRPGDLSMEELTLSAALSLGSLPEGFLNGGAAHHTGPLGQGSQRTGPGDRRKTVGGCLPATSSTRTYAHATAA